MLSDTARLPPVSGGRHPTGQRPVGSGDWRPPDLSGEVRPGSVRDKYVRLVSSAHYGCVL